MVAFSRVSLLPRLLHMHKSSSFSFSSFCHKAAFRFLPFFSAVILLHRYSDSSKDARI